MTPKQNTAAPRIDREAADWVVHWEDQQHPPTLKEQARWFVWLRRSPQHVQSYFDTADLYEQLGKIDSDHQLDIDEWLARAPISVTAITPTALRPGTLTAPKHSWRGRWALAAMIATLIFGVLAWNLQGHGGERYRTAIGQQNTYQLLDGSTMKLNTRSRARVRFSEEYRLIELEGEGLFTVAHDANRPFYVRTSGATVRAVGTKFNVYEATGQTQVAVVEGVVQVTLGSKIIPAAVTQPPQPLRVGSAPRVSTSTVALGAGETARVIDGRIEKQTLPDPAVAVAWQMHKLVFEDAKLSEVVAQFNRYNTGQIYVDKSIGDTKRLSGTFNAIYPQSLLLYLAKDRDLSVDREGADYRIVRQPR